MTPSHPIFRFAPSPNGYLHLGHAYSALFTAHWAGRLGGRLLLRIEDTDITRCRPEFTTAILEDLEWLGLAWDQPVWRQSERFAVYQQAANRLAEMGLLYPCFCTRTEIAAGATGRDPDGAPIYPGTCRHRDPGEVSERLKAGEIAQWRLQSELAIARAGARTFPLAQPTPADGPEIRAARPERWGDVVISRKGTPTSYHLSVVVDDAAQGVTHVTRGRDMEAATDIHVLLQALLGLPTPVYTFHELILDETGRKLAKSKGSETLRDMREAGWTAAAIRARLGFGT